MFASQDPSREVTAFSIAIGPEQISLFIKNKKAAPESNASQLSLTGIVFIGFFYTVFLWPWLHAAGVASFPSCRQHKLP
ncbi:hypothetical protein, partial [Aeromonas sp. 5HA1]|uniref:hypothetical protein n=1 Tax=Aeromonas sp. 5HA1 TaxID=2699197 RepID=UPI0023DE0FE5